jgi:hypothetical protein
VISLGTGENPFKEIDPNDVHRKDFMVKSGEFMMNMETYTSDFGLRSSIEKPEDNYLRMQTVSTLKMDRIDPENIEGLK